MNKLWTEERVTHHGRYFDMDDVPGAGALAPGQVPKVYIAANLDQGIVRAARESDGWLVSSRATLPTIERQVGLYRKAAEENGKRGFISAWREMFVAETREEAVAIARPHVEWLYRDRASLGHSQELPEADRIDVAFDQVLEDRFIIGSPAECIEEIKKYQALGVDELVLRCQWPGMPNEDSLRAVELFGKEVLPAFR